MKTKDEPEWGFCEFEVPMAPDAPLVMRRKHGHYLVEVVSWAFGAYTHAYFYLGDGARIRHPIPAQRWHRDKQALADIVRIKYGMEVQIEN